MSGTVPGQPQPQVTTQGPPNDIQAAGIYNSDQNNSESVINAYLQAHGVNPMNHSGPGAYMKAIMAKIVPQLFNMNYGSDGNMALDTAANPTKLLDQIFANGPNMGANMRDFANTALSHLTSSPNMQNMSTAKLQDFLTSAQAMQQFGNNPYESLANLQGLQDQFGRFALGQGNYFNHRPGGIDPNQTLYQWIMQNAAGQLGLSPSNPASVLGGGGGGAGGAGGAGSGLGLGPPPQVQQINGGLGNGRPY